MAGIQYNEESYLNYLSTITNDVVVLNPDFWACYNYLTSLQNKTESQKKILAAFKLLIIEEGLDVFTYSN